MSSDKLAALLREERVMLGAFQRDGHSDGKWSAWIQKMDVILRNNFPGETPERLQFRSAIDWDGTIRGSTQETRDENRNVGFERILRRTVAWLDALIFQMETFGFADQTPVDAAVIPWRYRLFSPVYWFERLWARLVTIAEWIAKHRIHSFVVGAASLAASIVAILAGTGTI